MVRPEDDWLVPRPEDAWLVAGVKNCGQWELALAASKTGLPWAEPIGRPHGWREWRAWWQLRSFLGWW